MTTRNRCLLRDQNKAKLMVQTVDDHAVRLVWTATLSAAIAAFWFYFFSLFFSGVEWRALTDR